MVPDSYSVPTHLLANFGCLVSVRPCEQVMVPIRNIGNIGLGVSDLQVHHV